MSYSIVAGTDGSPSAERAMGEAAVIGRALGATVHVVNCYRRPAPNAWAAAGGFAVTDSLSDEDALTAAEQIVAVACRRLRESGVSAEAHVCSGDPADVLCTVAEREGAAMIVVGNRGMSGPRRVLGSVPNSVSHRARCAVLIVPTA